MDLKQKYNPAAFSSSEMAFQSNSQPLQLSPAEQRLARGWNSQAGMLFSVLLTGSVSPCSCTQRVKNSIKLEPQQCAEIYIFSSSLSIFKEPQAVTLAPQPGWSLCWGACSGRWQLFLGRICSEGRHVGGR